VNHHPRFNSNEHYHGRKSYLPTMAGFGTQPRLPMPIIVFGLIGLAPVVWLAVRTFTGA
jgi:hypothetical protein